MFDDFVLLYDTDKKVAIERERLRKDLDQRELQMSKTENRVEVHKETFTRATSNKNVGSACATQCIIFCTCA